MGNYRHRPQPVRHAQPVDRRPRRHEPERYRRSPEQHLNPATAKRDGRLQDHRIERYRSGILPAAVVITNTKAAFEASGLNWSNLNYSAPYVGPQLAPNSFGYRVYLYGPWQNHFDLSLHKTTRITERINVEFRANCLDCLNLTNFQFGTSIPAAPASARPPRLTRISPTRRIRVTA